MEGSRSISAEAGLQTLDDSEAAVRQLVGKRLIDVALSAIGLVFTSPLWVIIAIVIKLNDGGPILYRQRRWGMGATTFEVLKFRTMVADSDSRHGITQASENDDRVTRVGRMLRATGLDELPQFLNILRGEMSFVGPRALAVGEILYDNDGKRVIYENLSHFSRRLAVRPGLTGMATIHLAKDAPLLDKLKMDLAYVDNHSVALDIRLIALSLWISIRGGWEKRGPKF